jgi:LacI family transcriptional regulator
MSKAVDPGTHSGRRWVGHLGAGAAIQISGAGQMGIGDSQRQGKAKQAASAKRPRGPSMRDVATLADVSQTTVSLVLNRALGVRVAEQTRQRVFEAADKVGYNIVARRAARTAARGARMTDVAAMAGVSQTTVSLVLNGALGARLSEQTRKRVFEVATQLGYRLVGRGPARSETSAAKFIGLVVDEMSTDPWCAIALDGAREKAWEHGLTINAGVTRGDPEIEKAVLAQMANQSLLGLIYGTIQTRKIAPNPALHRVPTVLLNCYLADGSLTSIVPGEVLGGRTATERLIRSGHVRIGLIEGERWMDASRDRLKGYRQALASQEIPFDPALVRPGNWELSAGYEQTIALMRLPRPPTAIFCANDVMAVGCYEALKELGYEIPNDVSVIGYDDREIAHCTRPPLTTILLPHFEMGMLAAETIIDYAGRPGGRAAHIKVECPLVERGSVGALTIDGVD